MSKTALTSQTVMLSGDGLSYQDGPDVVTNAAAVPPSTQALTTGPNTVSVPAGAMGVKIKPPPTNGQTITLKGVTGDTGNALSKVEPTTWLFDTIPPATFVLTVGGNVTVALVWC